ncbi:uncharacterized protein SCHCODRAFT_02605758 [Schizophyllum commune H4-8]|nr:uncharacterized protein SCHCODRAFT_02605758 [Schizophyllum commune H4-8]KAI5899656.1 hypothetical protein SCHCODRAFT_02605758 [Schizophyllum commune H4-8]
MLSEQLEPLTLSTITCSQVNTTTLAVPLEVIRSSALPSATDSVDLRRAAMADQESLSSVDEAMFTLQRKLDELRAQRDRLSIEQERKLALIAPVRRLPTEVLMLIIELAMELSFAHEPDSSLMVIHPVTLVCQRWRTLAFAAPRLWAKIVLYPAFDKLCLHTLRTCLVLSKAHPLDIHIDSSRPKWRKLTGVPDYTDSAPEDLWNSLLAHASRWKSLALKAINPPTSILQQTPSLPLLQHLHLEDFDTDDGDFDTDDGRLAFFRNTPSLSHVSLWNTDSTQLDLSWDRLVRLQLYVEDAGELHPHFQVYSRCSNLQELRLEMDDYPDEHDSNFDISLPALHTIELIGFSSCLLLSLVAPQLQQLRIMTDTTDSEVKKHLMEFADKNEDTVASVTTLWMRDWGSDQVMWTEVLKGYLGVSTLRVVEGYQQDDADQTSGTFFEPSRLALLCYQTSHILTSGSGKCAPRPIWVLLAISLRAGRRTHRSSRT